MPRMILGLIVALSLTASLLGEPARNHDVTVDDYFTLATVTGVAMSPDGKHVAYTEARWQQSTNDRKTDVWVIDVEKAESRRLTSDRANDRVLKWAADSKTLYFLGNRKREAEKQ